MAAPKALHSSSILLCRIPENRTSTGRVSPWPANSLVSAGRATPGGRGAGAAPQLVDSVVQNPRNPHQHRQGQPLAGELLGQRMQVHARVPGARVGARDHMALGVDVEVATAPRGDVVGVAGGLY